MLAELLTPIMSMHLHFSAIAAGMWENERPPWLGQCSYAKYATEFANAQAR